MTFETSLEDLLHQQLLLVALARMDASWTLTQVSL